MRSICFIAIGFIGILQKGGERQTTAAVVLDAHARVVPGRIGQAIEDVDESLRDHGGGPLQDPVRGNGPEITYGGHHPSLVSVRSLLRVKPPMNRGMVAQIFTSWNPLMGWV